MGYDCIMDKRRGCRLLLRQLPRHAEKLPAWRKLGRLPRLQTLARSHAPFCYLTRRQIIDYNISMSVMTSGNENSRRVGSAKKQRNETVFLTCVRG